MSSPQGQDLLNSSPTHEASILMSAMQIQESLESMAQAIHAAIPVKSDQLALVGIHQRGVPVAERLAGLLNPLGWDPKMGQIDISLYRDDHAQRTVVTQLKGTDLPFDLDGSHVILCDEVLFTGRTIRAAIEQLMDYGRPARIWLAVLIDRGYRELPIAPDFVGRTIETPQSSYVFVKLRPIDEEDVVELHTR